MKIEKNARCKKLKIIYAIESIFLLKICLETFLRNLGYLPKWDKDHDILVVPFLPLLRFRSAIYSSRSKVTRLVMTHKWTFENTELLHTLEIILT